MHQNSASFAFCCHSWDDGGLSAAARLVPGPCRWPRSPVSAPQRQLRAGPVPASQRRAHYALSGQPAQVSPASQSPPPTASPESAPASLQPLSTLLLNPVLPPYLVRCRNPPIWKSCDWHRNLRTTHCSFTFSNSPVAQLPARYPKCPSHFSLKNIQPAHLQHHSNPSN